MAHEPVAIAGPMRNPKAPREKPPAGAWDAHAHVFGPADKFPYTPGRGYTPPDAPVENFVALLDHNGCAHGLVVQGNAHGYDNRVVLDAMSRFPQRLRGVAITDTRIAPETLRDWHKIGMRGLRFHLFEQKPSYVRGVGLDVFEVFRKTMAELGWVMQLFCDWRLMRIPRLRLRADCARDAGDRRSLRDDAGGARRQRSEFPGAAEAGRRRRCAREGLGALPRLHAISGLCRRAAAARGAGRRQSGAADVGHRLAASLDRRRGDAGRRAFAGFVV